MGQSTIKITGLTRIQANVLAIMFEEGKISGMINEKLETFTPDSDHDYSKIEEIPSINFDADDDIVDHIIEY